MAMAMAFPGASIQLAQRPQLKLGPSSFRQRSLAMSCRQHRLVSIRASDVDTTAAADSIAEPAAEFNEVAEEAQGEAEAQEETEVPKSEEEEQAEAAEAAEAKAEKMARLGQKKLLSLRFLWMDNAIGIGLDQLVPGCGTIPVSPFYFWPKKDAWEELKALLESKPWISKRRAIILLNQATDIINLWQQKQATL